MKELEGQFVIHAPEGGMYQLITPELPDELLQKFTQIALQYDTDEDRMLWLIHATQIGSLCALMQVELPLVKIVISNEGA